MQINQVKPYIYGWTLLFLALFTLPTHAQDKAKLTADYLYYNESKRQVIASSNASVCTINNYQDNRIKKTKKEYTKMNFSFIHNNNGAENALKLNPKNTYTQLNIGDTYFQLGDIKEAYSYWKKASVSPHLQHLLQRRVCYLNQASLGPNHWIENTQASLSSKPFKNS